MEGREYNMGRIQLDVVLIGWRPGGVGVGMFVIRGRGYGGARCSLQCQGQLRSGINA